MDGLDICWSSPAQEYLRSPMGVAQGLLLSLVKRAVLLQQQDEDTFKGAMVHL